MTVVNRYFDFDDYKSPIKSFLDDRFTYMTLPGYKVNQNVRKYTTYSMSSKLLLITYIDLPEEQQSRDAG